MKSPKKAIGDAMALRGANKDKRNPSVVNKSLQPLTRLAKKSKKMQGQRAHKEEKKKKQGQRAHMEEKTCKTKEPAR